jgi:hypothetical protein
MKTVFISYSRDDLDFVENEIVSEIEKLNGVNCWLDIHDIEAGAESFPDVIKQGMEECFIFLIMLSKSSMKKEWPLKELKDAETYKAKDPSRKIVLVNIDNSELIGEFEEYKERDIIYWNITYQHQKLLNNIDRWNRNKTESLMAEGKRLEKLSQKDDIKRAFYMFTLAANMGLAEAQSKVAYYYKTGKDSVVEKDLGEALNWCGKAYKQGFPGAASLMATISKEIGDNADFIRFHKEAAECGWKFSQYQIGKAYYNNVIDGDIIDAIFWLKKAANQNQPDAIKLLSHILRKNFKHQEELAKEYSSKANNPKNK